MALGFRTPGTLFGCSTRRAGDLRGDEWRKTPGEPRKTERKPTRSGWLEPEKNGIYHQLIYQWSSTDISSTDHQKQGLNQEKLAYGQQKECKPQKWWFNPKKAPGWWKSTLCGIYIHGLISHQTDLTGSDRLWNKLFKWLPSPDTLKKKNVVLRIPVYGKPLP